MMYFKTKISTPLLYFKAGQFICEENWIHNPFNFDNEYEIIVGITGTLYIQQGTEKFEVNPGDVLLLTPKVTHLGYAPSKEGSSFYWLHFFCTEQMQVFNQTEIYEEVISMLDKDKLQENILLPTFFSLTDTGKAFIYLKQILHIANSPYYTHLTANYLLSAFVTELTQQFITSFNFSIMKERLVNKRFFDILEWIRVNITKNISVQAVADKFNFTPDYITRLFKKNLGMSTLKYINDIKINKAKELLINSDKNIKEISYMLCFKDEKYFMKLFKRYEGVTPSKYRDAYPKTYINTDSCDGYVPTNVINLRKKFGFYKNPNFFYF